MSIFEDGVEYLEKEEVAALAGIRDPNSVTYLVSQTRRRIASGRVQPYDIPLPARRVKRRLERRKPWAATAAWYNQWTRAQVDAWLAVRADPHRYDEVFARPRNDKGQFLSRQEAAS